MKSSLSLGGVWGEAEAIMRCEETPKYSEKAGQQTSMQASFKRYSPFIFSGGFLENVLFAIDGQNPVLQNALPLILRTLDFVVHA